MKSLCLILAVLVMPFSVNGQCPAFCKNESLKSSFQQLLTNLPQGFTFLKSYSAYKYYGSGKAWYFLTENFDIQNNPRKDFVLAKNNLIRRVNEYTLILSKGSTYWFGFSEKDNSKGIVGTVYNSFEDKNGNFIREELATNYISNTFYKGFYFKCNATGIYQLNIKFQDSENCYGAAILALKTKHDEK